MSARSADMSAATTALCAEMYDNGMIVPDLDGLQQYRRDVRTGFEPWVRTAVAAFQGDIESGNRVGSARIPRHVIARVII
ncbi:MAG: hypothetical protein GY815_01010 [Gammaproteobacteria bacterium]|nr:hypothetical protein [Gammaproteobacteria bacterium]